MATIEELIYIDATGFHYPDYPTLLGFYQDQFRTIYGADVYIEADSQDGQMVALFAQSVYDLCVVFAGVYTSFSPTYAQGDALSRNVAINGIARRAETFSTVDLTITGTAGTVITNGKARDTSGLLWSLPSPTTIGGGGTVTVTATCDTGGSISAGIGAVNATATPTKGWLSVTNASAATEGIDMESDAELRARQALSTMLASIGTVGSIESAIADVDGVIDQRVYENDTGSTDSDGITAHTIAAVVDGGDAQDIVDAIGVTKSAGCNTQGTTSGTYTDSRGNTNTINFYRPTPATIGVDIDITALSGYTSSYEDDLKQAVADAINALRIGDDVLITRLYAPATLAGTAAGLTYNLTALQIKKNAGSFGTADLTIAFNEVAECDPASDITVTVT